MMRDVIKVEYIQTIMSYFERGQFGLDEDQGTDAAAEHRRQVAWQRRFAQGAERGHQSRAWEMHMDSPEGQAAREPSRETFMEFTYPVDRNAPPGVIRADASAGTIPNILEAARRASGRERIPFGPQPYYVATPYYQRQRETQAMIGSRSRASMARAQPGHFPHSASGRGDEMRRRRRAEIAEMYEEMLAQRPARQGGRAPERARPAMQEDEDPADYDLLYSKRRK